jgi:flavin-dependent dehydrogenase
MYDAIVVGARCAGAPTAMLLARAGHRVLLVDKSDVPSDTLSSHYIHQPGVSCLRRWGLLEAVEGTGCPPIRRYRFDVGPFALRGTPPPGDDGIDMAYSVKRAVLDELLARAAEAAGAELRPRFTVTDVVVEDGRVTGVRGRQDGGAVVTEHARIVIGADGRHSRVARAVRAEEYDVVPPLTCAYYTYYAGVPIDGVELYPRPGRMIVAAPTNDGHVLVIVLWPVGEFARVRRDVRRHFDQALTLAPDLAARVAAARRAGRVRGAVQAPNGFRKPWGDGWALVGDAGYHKDPILALGMADAFRDAELLAGAIKAGFAGRAPLADALAAYEQRRNMLSAAGYANTIRFALLQPPPPAMQEMLAGLRDDQGATDRFFGTFAGTVPAAAPTAA